MEAGGVKMAKRKSALEWELIITDCKTSGLPVARWCEMNRIKLSTYKYWVTRLNKQNKTETNISWAEVKIPAAQTSICPTTSLITLRCEGFSVDISEAVETQWLAEILKTLRAIC